MRAVTVVVEADNDVGALRKLQEIVAQPLGALALLVDAGITITRTSKGPAARVIEATPRPTPGGPEPTWDLAGDPGAKG